LELFFQGNLWDQFSHSGSRSKFAKIGKKTACTSPTFFMFKIFMPLDSVSCEILEHFTEGNSGKSKIKAQIGKNTFVWAFIIQG